MRIKFPKSKRIQAALAITVAAVVVLLGTFAWSSFLQNRINTFDLSLHPGVNLHDDFDEGPDKDVYVENSGDIGVFVRVRLTEYLETAGQGSLVDGHNHDEGSEKYWHTHNGIGGAELCSIDHPYTHGELWHGEGFHDYYTWTMGGQKYYKTAAAQLGEENALAESPEVCVDTTVYTAADEENGIRQTLPATVITIAEWLEGDRDFGHFWIVDTDGWCYWADILSPGEATGLLLDNVSRTEKKFGSDATYRIDVWLQAADAADVELFYVGANGGITDAGKLFIQLISGEQLIVGEDGYYESLSDGAFVQISGKNGEAPEDSRAFVPLEEASVDAPERIYLDGTIMLEPLVWNGTDYANFTDFGDNAPFYNIGQGGTEITITGVETGEDGMIYLALADGTYLASVTKNSPYRQSYPGTGPFGVLYAGEDGEIGTDDDRRYDVESFEQRFFYHLGNGVYVETASESGTESIDAPVKYYFAGEYIDGESGAYAIEFNSFGALPVDEAVEEIFPLQLAVGDSFGLVFADNMVEIAPGGTGFTMQELGHDGTDLYIKFGKDGRVNPDSGGILGNRTATFTLPSPEGGGTQASPYLMKTRMDMDWLSAQAAALDAAALSAYYEVVGVDGVLDMSGESFVPIGIFTSITNEECWFTGYFNGNGVPITNFTISQTGSSIGLFVCIGSSGVVENVHLSNASISGGNYAGGIASWNYGTVQNCFVSGSVSSGLNNAGGIIGTNHGTIKNCYAWCDVSNTNVNLGGIAGSSYGTITNTYHAKGTITGSSRVGGILGYNYESAANISYSVALGSELIAANGNVGYKTIGSTYNNPTSSNLYAYDGMILKNTSGTQVSWVNNGLRTGDTAIDTQNPTYFWWKETFAGQDFANPDIWVWDGVNQLPVLKALYPELSVPDGTEDNPYLLSTRADLDLLSSAVTEESNFAGKYFKLANDIVMGETAFVPISYFGGELDGNGKTISGLTVSGTTYIGLIGIVEEGGRVKNLTMANAVVSGQGAVAAVAGENRGAVENCIVLDSAVTATMIYAGGVVGGNKGTVEACSVTDTSEVNGAGGIGGIAGRNEGSILSCQNAAPVTASGDAVGGVVGQNAGSISGSYNTATVSSTSSNVGGVAGQNSGSISGSYNTATVSGNRYTGGVVGENSGSINKCYSTATVTGSGGGVGGVAGGNFAEGTISDCFAWGDIIGTGVYSYSGSGGIVGSNSAYVTNSYHAKGLISSQQESAGGIAGYSLVAGGVTSSFAMASSVAAVNGSSQYTIAYLHTFATISGCYYTPSLGSININDGSTESAVPTQQSGWPVESFDFSDVWRWDDEVGLPVLRVG